MPKTSRFTKNEIIDVAIELVRENGFSYVSARNIASRLNSSSKVIFSVFKNMEEVVYETIKRADQIQQEFAKSVIDKKEFPIYKCLGMGYILFAKKEKELFKLLYMRDRSSENKNDGNIDEAINIIEKTTGLTPQEAYRFHLEMWIYVHGFATMIASNYLDWEVDIISKMLSDVYQGLLLNRVKKEKV